MTGTAGVQKSAIRRFILVLALKKSGTKAILIEVWEETPL
jgi:hypothetical protein